MKRATSLLLRKTFSKSTTSLKLYPTTNTTSTSKRYLNVVSRPSDLIGNTPLIDLSTILKNHGVDTSHGTKLVGKLESLGPCSSVKDRLGRSLIDEAEKQGLITPGKTVLVEPTSGNTGIALAFIARERGYRCILTMPESMSIERRIMLMSLGAEVVLTPKETAVPGALAKAKEIIEQLNGDGYMLQQFENPANPKIHRETTGPEIWRDTDGLVDILVSGCGTGGTITGISQYIKGSAQHNCPPLKPELLTVAVEPMEQMLITEAKGGQKIGPQGPHRIQGMGPGMVPKVLDLDLIDEVVAVHSDEATEMCHELWMMGLPVGISSGAIVQAAVNVCKRPEASGKFVVAIIPSFGERYFTHPMFAKVKDQAEKLQKQPLPEPFDNRDYGFATSRG
jgi:cysteine synthase A